LLAAACLERPIAEYPEVDPAAPLQFVINAAAGRGDAETKREVIETALRLAGRRGAGDCGWIAV
jgi:hypothetical protein